MAYIIGDPIKANCLFQIFQYLNLESEVNPAQFIFNSFIIENNYSRDELISLLYDIVQENNLNNYERMLNVLEELGKLRIDIECEVTLLKLRILQLNKNKLSDIDFFNKTFNIINQYNIKFPPKKELVAYEVNLLLEDGYDKNQLRINQLQGFIKNNPA